MTRFMDHLGPIEEVSHEELIEALRHLPACSLQHLADWIKERRCEERLRELNSFLDGYFTIDEVDEWLARKRDGVAFLGYDTP